MEGEEGEEEDRVDGDRVRRAVRVMTVVDI